jgi:shikimate kinase/very-short-patch-repair endonuclease
MTPAETILWQRLRNKQLAGFKFRRQEPMGPYIADFFCFDARLVVELDGSSHEGRIETDAKKDSFLTKLGYQVLRFRNQDVYDNLNGVLETIEKFCNARSAPTQPPPEGEEFSGPIVLIGFMACGKSSVARALAKRLKCEATDVDTLIENAAGKTIPAIFAEDGEDEFRRLETKQLKAALEYSQPARVIATGGGIVTRAENRIVLQDAAAAGVLVVYLRASSEVLARRIRRQPGTRPLIDGGKILNLAQTRARVEELLAERAPLYESVANLIIESDEMRSPQATARKIHQTLNAPKSNI